VYRDAITTTRTITTLEEDEWMDGRISRRFDSENRSSRSQKSSMDEDKRRKTSYRLSDTVYPYDTELTTSFARPFHIYDSAIALKSPFLLSPTNGPLSSSTRRSTFLVKWIRCKRILSNGKKGGLHRLWVFNEEWMDVGVSGVKEQQPLSSHFFVIP